MRKNKIYGYMVGYRELGSRFVRYYTDFTYSRALSVLHRYQKYPQRERETNRPLIDPVWEIQPITKKAIMRSILDELPFLYNDVHFTFIGWAYGSIAKNESQREKKFCFSPRLIPLKIFYRFFADFRNNKISRLMQLFHYATWALPKRQNKTIGVKELCTKKISSKALTFGEMEIYYISFLMFPLKNMCNICKLSTM